MEESRLPLRKWAIAIYLETTNLKGVSSMKLHRDIRVSQKTAWFMLHRIREAWKPERGDRFEGPVEIDETFVGGKAKNARSSSHGTIRGSRLRNMSTTLRHSQAAFSEPRLWRGDS